MSSWRALAGGVAAALVLVAAPARAQVLVARGPVRDGFTIGFAVGGGAVNFRPESTDASTEGAMFVSFRLGGSLSPRLQLLYDAEVQAFPIKSIGGSGSNAVFTSAINAFAVQAFLLPRLWVKVGAGLAFLRLNDDAWRGTIESKAGLGTLAAIGIELYQGRAFALDLEVSAAPAFWDHLTVANGGVGVGFQWY